MNDQDSASITFHTNTVFTHTGDTALVSRNGTDFTAATLASHEATALPSDPLFDNTSSLPFGFSSGVANTTGLGLQAASPSSASGADLGSAYQSSINGVDRSGSWDRGAYREADTNQFVAGLRLFRYGYITVARQVGWGRHLVNCTCSQRSLSNYEISQIQAMEFHL